MKTSRIVGPALAAVVLVGAVGGCQTDNGSYQDTYEEEPVVSPNGVGDTMAVYRTSGTTTTTTPATVTTTTAVTSPAPPVSRDTAVVTQQATTTTTTVQGEPSVMVVDRGGASTLRVDVITPASALICEDIPVRFLITNASGVDAPDAYLQATLPPGLKTAKGDTTVSMNVGLVPANGTREVTVPVRAERSGSFLSLASVSPDPDVRTSVVESAMVVGQPVLNLTLDAMEPSAEANVVVVTLRVSNTGNVASIDTVVTGAMSPNTRPVDPGIAVASQDLLVWNFGTLAPGEIKQATVRLDAFQPGVVTGKATAAGRCAEPAMASFSKAVR
jgi:hypothetical protein